MVADANELTISSSNLKIFDMVIKAEIDSVIDDENSGVLPMITTEHF